MSWSMSAADRERADALRAWISRGDHAANAAFRAAFAAVAPIDRDDWVDRVLATGDLPDDGPELPRGCVPYLPCAVEPLLRALELARVGPDDVFVDIGSGLGRVAMFAQLWTGAEVLGVEVQPALVASARELARQLQLSRVAFAVGDAAATPALFARGSVFFLYCPFGGDRLVAVVRALEAIARARTIRVCCVDLPIPACEWLSRVTPTIDANDGVAVYTSR